MNPSRTAVRTAPLDPTQRRIALGMALGGVVALVWAGAMLYTLAGWIF
ncbi:MULTISPECIES: morphogenic membrane protein MmpA [unclassified Streptomyces]